MNLRAVFLLPRKDTKMNSADDVRFDAVLIERDALRDSAIALLRQYDWCVSEGLSANGFMERELAAMRLVIERTGE